MRTIVRSLVLFAFLGAQILSSAEGAPEVAKETGAARHPGCMIWWFIHGCPLAKVFGTDPFGLYPWEKFCKRYPEAFGGIEECKAFILPDSSDDISEAVETNNNEVGQQEEKDTEKEDEVVGRASAEIGSKSKAAMKENQQLVFLKSLDSERRSDLMTCIKEKQDLEINIALNICREKMGLDNENGEEKLKARTKRETKALKECQAAIDLVDSKWSKQLLHKDAWYMKICLDRRNSSTREEAIAYCLRECKKTKTDPIMRRPLGIPLSRAQRAINPDYLKPGQTLFIGGDGSEAFNRCMRYGSGQYAGHQRQLHCISMAGRRKRSVERARARLPKVSPISSDHPGCTHFWFLPGCPLGDIMVDPARNYPWETLCQYEKLRHVPQCNGSFS